MAAALLRFTDLTGFVSTSDSWSDSVNEASSSSDEIIFFFHIAGFKKVWIMNVRLFVQQKKPPAAPGGLPNYTLNKTIYSPCPTCQSVD